MNEMLLKLWVNTENHVVQPVGRKLKKLHEERDGGIAEYAVVVGIAVVFGIAILTIFWEKIEIFFGDLGDKIAELINLR